MNINSIRKLWHSALTITLGLTCVPLVFAQEARLDLPSSLNSFMRESKPARFSTATLQRSGDFGAGNSGRGRVIHGKLHLLDFYRHNLRTEDSIYIGPSDPNWESYFLKRVEKLEPILETDLSLLAQKLSSMMVYLPLFTLNLVEYIEEYNWSVEEGSILFAPDQAQVHDGEIQLAVRLERTIVIDKESFERLSRKSKIGLIFHEAVYASQRPRGLNDIDVSGRYKNNRKLSDADLVYQNPKKAMEHNAALFNKENFKKVGVFAEKAILNDHNFEYYRIADSTRRAVLDPKSHVAYENLTLVIATGNVAAYAGDSNLDYETLNYWCSSSLDEFRISISYDTQWPNRHAWMSYANNSAAINDSFYLLDPYQSTRKEIQFNVKQARNSSYGDKTAGCVKKLIAAFRSLAEENNVEQLFAFPQK